VKFIFFRFGINTNFLEKLKTTLPGDYGPNEYSNQFLFPLSPLFLILFIFGDIPYNFSNSSLSLIICFYFIIS